MRFFHLIGCVGFLALTLACTKEVPTKNFGFTNALSGGGNYVASGTSSDTVLQLFSDGTYAATTPALEEGGTFTDDGSTLSFARSYTIDTSGTRAAVSHAYSCTYTFSNTALFLTCPNAEITEQASALAMSL